MLEKIKANRTNLVFMAYVINDDFLYFSDWTKNGLFRINLINQECEFLALFEGDINKSGLHTCAVKYKSEIWFIPERMENRIAVYHLDTLQIEYINIPKAENIGVNRLFSCAYVYNGSIWLAPGDYDAFIKINPLKRKLFRYEFNVQSQRNGHSKFIQSMMHDGKIYLCPWAVTELVYFDCAIEKVIHHISEFPIIKYRTIHYYNDRIYFTARNLQEGILVYDKKQLQELIPNEFPEEICIGTFVGTDGMLWMFAYESEKIYRFHLETREYKEIELFKGNVCVHNSKGWAESRETDEYVIISSLGELCPTFIYDKKNNVISQLEVKESKSLFLDYLIHAIEDTHKCFNNEKEEVGKKIYKKMRIGKK